MRVYHGTVEAFLPAIQSEGLKYTPAHSFKMHSLFRELAIENGVYLSTVSKNAKMMAYVKAIYLAKKEGDYVPGTEGPQWKDSDLVIKTKPVLLTLEIPDTMKAELKRDPDWPTKSGLIYHGNIPPSCIQKVEVLEHANAL